MPLSFTSKSLIFLAACCFLYSVPEAQALRVYPLGDSITHGSTAAGGYRSPLYEKLTALGYHVDMVGSTQEFADRILIDAGERHHDGHSGWTISQIDQKVVSWLSRFEPPDVILVHIGTNDFRGGVSNKRAIDQLDDLMTKLATTSPDSHLIVTNLMERAGSANRHIEADFNPFVEEKIAGQVALGRNVSFLDMRSAVPISDMPDKLHPNKTGLIKMADAYLGEILKVAGPPFQITDITVSKGDPGMAAAITWTSRPNRDYTIQVSEDQVAWRDLPYSVKSTGPTTTAQIGRTAGIRSQFVRVREGLPSQDLMVETTVQWMVPTDNSLETLWTNPTLPDGANFTTGLGLGVGFETNPGSFDPLIETGVLEPMLQVNASIYLRYEFALPSNQVQRSIAFSMRYDDGFVAYLNGTPIASRNAPEEITWNSAATGSHRDSEAIVFESIEIENALDLLRPGQTNVLAIHGLNTLAGGSDFLMMPSLTTSFEGGNPE